MDFWRSNLGNKVEIPKGYLHNAKIWEEITILGIKIETLDRFCKIQLTSVQKERRGVILGEAMSKNRENWKMDVC